MTKIDDENGCRNEFALVRRGSMWWLPDGTMYVYYRPTHYREMTSYELALERRLLLQKAEAMRAEADRISKAI